MPTATPSTRHNGVIYCVVFHLLFWWVATTFVQRTSGVMGFVWDSVERAVFGAAALCLLTKDFQKGKWTDVIHFRNFKEGILAGSAFFLTILFFGVQLTMATGSFVETTAPILFAHLFLQQITTGFWEELVFRGFVLESYFSSENRTRKARIGYAFLSAALFGLVHTIIIEGSRVTLSLDSFLVTGILGFALAAVYLYSHNLLAAMVWHFVYDIFANASKYTAELNDSMAAMLWKSGHNNTVFYIILGLIFAGALVCLIKEPIDQGMEKEWASYA